jgi:RimJ/RimL family protein N-acetyltransferase
MLADDVIYLRKLEESDLERTWKWMNDPEVFFAIGVDVPINKTAQKRWFHELDQSTSKTVFAICLHEGDTHVGNVSLDSIHRRHRNARLSIFLADSPTRGKSLGTRAMRLLIEYAFEFLNLHRLYCKTTAGNPAVLNFYQNLGFKVEGQLREHEYIQGQYVNKIMLGLLRSDLPPSS